MARQPMPVATPRPMAAAGGTVIVWQLASSVGWLPTRVLPSPEGVLKAFWTLSASGELWQHLAISSWRALGQLRHRRLDRANTPA